MKPTLVIALAVVALLAPPLFAQDQRAGSSPAARLVGVWRLNPELSDKSPIPPDGRAQQGRGRGGGGGRGGGRGRARGGFGRGNGGGRGSGQPDDARVRQMSAVRDLIDAPERLTITTAGAMVIIAAGDGRTTRLMSDGSEVKDESTKVTRTSRWDGERLVTAISGLVRGTVTETYSVDRESGRLMVTVFFENLPGPMAPRGGPPPDRGGTDPGDRQADGASPSAGRTRTRDADERGRTFTRVYEAEQS